MRIVTWNTSQKTNVRVRRAMVELHPDVLVAPETSSTPDFSKGGQVVLNPGHVWTPVAGSTSTKGLGIYVKEFGSITKLDQPKSDAPTALAGRIDDREGSTNIVGVWTQPSPHKGEMHGPYMQSLTDIIEDFVPLITLGNTIVAGDFNVSASLSPRDFTPFFNHLEDDLGLVSAYHAFTGRKFGEEPNEDSTYWMKSKGALTGFHIDYVLVPKSWRIQRCEIGKQLEWANGPHDEMSDHAPVIVDLEIPSEVR